MSFDFRHDFQWKLSRSSKLRTHIKKSLTSNTLMVISKILLKNFIHSLFHPRHKIKIIFDPNKSIILLSSHEVKNTKNNKKTTKTVKNTCISLKLTDTTTKSGMNGNNMVSGLMFFYLFIMLSFINQTYKLPKEKDFGVMNINGI